MLEPKHDIGENVWVLGTIRGAWVTKDKVGYSIAFESDGIYIDEKNVRPYNSIKENNNEQT